MSCHHNILPKFPMTTTQDSVVSWFSMEPLHPRKTPHDVFAKKIIKEGQNLSFFKYRSQKKFPIQNTQILYKGLPKDGFQMVPNTPSNPLFPTFPMTNPTQKSSKVVHFFMFMSGSAFFGARFCIFF
jgi:hypothetical protein